MVKPEAERTQAGADHTAPELLVSHPATITRSTSIRMAMRITPTLLIPALFGLSAVVVAADQQAILVRAETKAETAEHAATTEVAAAVVVAVQLALAQVAVL